LANPVKFTHTWRAISIIGGVGIAALIAYVFYEGGQDRAGEPVVPVAEDQNSSETDARDVVVSDHILPSFDVVRVSRSGTGVIAGRAAPGANVEVYANDNLIGTVIADANGEWVMIPEQPLDPGSAEMSIVAKLPGEEAVQSANIVVISVPERARDQFVESDSNGVVAILTPRDGSGPSRILQRPGAQPVGEIGDSLSLDTIDYDASGSPLISGRALPRAQIFIYLDEDFAGATRADDDGRWTISASEPFSPGNHVLRTDQIINGGGDVQLRLLQPFTTGGTIDEALQSAKVVVQPGNSLWHIARRIYGSGIRYTLIFQENDDQIGDPDLIYPGQLFALPGLGGAGQDLDGDSEDEEGGSGGG
jgi:nucleoid-associated protein YgaU